MRSMTALFPAVLRLLLSAALAMTIVMAQGASGARAQGYYDDDPDGPPPMPRQDSRDGSYDDNGPYDPSADDNDDYEDGRSVPDVSYFYDPLERDGRWVNHPRYGLVWMPRHVDRQWRPYSMGHWAYTDDYGWYWVSDEPFGWATYHYGRWYYDERYAWVWIPGTRWAPAWVAWRSNDDYVGWAPLPPDAYWEPHHGLRYDDAVFESPRFSIYWSFVQPAYIVEPHVHRHFVPNDRSRQIFISTRTETHYEFTNKRIYNRGISVHQIEERGKIRIAPRRITTSNDHAFRGSDRIDGDDIKVFRPKLTHRDDRPEGAKPQGRPKGQTSLWYDVDRAKNNAATNPQPRFNAAPTGDGRWDGKGNAGRVEPKGNANPPASVREQPKSGSFWNGNTAPSGNSTMSKATHEDDVFRKYRGDPPAMRTVPPNPGTDARSIKNGNPAFGRNAGSVNGGNQGSGQANGQGGGNKPFGRPDRDGGSSSNGKNSSAKACEGPNCPKPDKH